MTVWRFPNVDCRLECTSTDRGKRNTSSQLEAEKNAWPDPWHSLTQLQLQLPRTWINLSCRRVVFPFSAIMSPSFGSSSVRLFQCPSIQLPSSPFSLCPCEQISQEFPFSRSFINSFAKKLYWRPFCLEAQENALLRYFEPSSHLLELINFSTREEKSMRLAVESSRLRGG